MKKGNNKAKLLKDEFAKYSFGKNVIEQAGFEKIGADLEVDIYEDIFITYFCYKCQSRSFGSLTCEEFSTGLDAFGVDKLIDIKSKIITSKENLLDITTPDFRKFYNFLFEYNLTVKSKKILDYDYVELYFNLLFSNQFKIVGTFLKFYTDVKKKEPMKQDPWNCFLDFLMKIGDNFPKGYNTSDSWPTLFDEFFVYYCEKNNIDMSEFENNNDE